MPGAWEQLAECGAEEEEEAAVGRGGGGRGSGGGGGKGAEGERGGEGAVPRRGGKAWLEELTLGVASGKCATLVAFAAEPGHN